MKHLTILLVLLGGCSSPQSDTRKPVHVTQEAPKPPNKPEPKVKESWQVEYEQLWQRRNVAIKDGSIHVGMTGSEFLKVWKLSELFHEPDKLSKSHFAGHEMLTLDYLDTTQGQYPGFRHVIFTFDNDSLQSWHEF